MKPVLGIIACNRTVGVENAFAVMERYAIAAMDHADCHALLVPPRDGDFEPKALVARLDGFLLTGSPSNVEPRHYGDDSDGVGPFDKGRDTVSLRLAAAMIEAGKPVFGICRGFQELNVLFGGSLRRDVGFGAERGNGINHHAPDDATFEALFDHYHGVNLTEGGALSRAYGTDSLRVNSVHYQGVDRFGDGLNIEAVADDGLIEAFSANVAGAQVLAVQWHPEWCVDQYPESQTYFKLLGLALRGEGVV